MMTARKFAGASSAQPMVTDDLDAKDDPEANEAAAAGPRPTVNGREVVRDLLRRTAELEAANARLQAEVAGHQAVVPGRSAYAVIEDGARTALSGHAAAFEGSMPYTRGGTRYGRASHIPPWNEQHRQVWGFFVSVSDSSAPEEAEASERRHLQELAHAARLVSLGEMAAELSHELAQPLSAIKGYAYACRSLLASGQAERASELLAKLGAQSELAAEIAGGYRRFVQKGLPEKHRVDLRELARSALKLVQWEADAHDVPVKLETPEAMPPVIADRTLIEQVISNLVRNAL